MRNVFDQYSQPENRLSHALATALHQDRAVLKGFLRWIGVGDAPRVDSLQVVEQRLPGEEEEGVELTEADSERRGLPDICIFDDGDRPWALAVESKAQAKAYSDQLKRHRSTLVKRGFPAPGLLLLTIDPAPPPDALPDGVAARQWHEVYAWLRRHHGGSFWSRAMTEYMEVFEAKMVAEEYSIRGTITMFDGLRFDDDHPYTYPEAKRLLRLMGEELRKDKRLLAIGVDLHATGRGAIKEGAGDNVWDFLPLAAAQGAASFTEHPHFSYYIRRRTAAAHLTVPNSGMAHLRRRLEHIGCGAFIDLVRDIEGRLRRVVEAAPGSKPTMYAVQGHFRARGPIRIDDARIDADLRISVPGGRNGVKHQPEWLEAIHRVLCQKRSNIQFGIGVEFPYTCEKVRSPEVLDLFAETWLGVRPALEIVAQPIIVG